MNLKLIEFLGECVFGNAESFFVKMNNSEQVMLCKTGIKYGVDAFFYWYLQERLPEPLEEKIRKDFHARSANSMRNQVGLNQLCKRFEDYEIRYCPLKGADIAYRIYPNPALRWFGDFDILIHPEDMKKALDILKEDGWASVLGWKIQGGMHHFPRHFKESYSLEIHQTLPQFKNINIKEIWDKLILAAQNQYHYILTPEMNMLLLTRHAAACSYTHLSVTKLLMDAAMMIQSDPIDWAKIRILSNKWHLPYPGDVLGAWQEFFPADILSQMDFDQNKAASFRKIFLLRWHVNQPSINSAPWVMSQAARFSPEWFSVRFSILRYERIRAKYKLSTKAGIYLAAWAYLREISSKTLGFFRYLFFPDKRIQAYMRLVNRAEKNASHTQDQFQKMNEKHNGAD